MQIRTYLARLFAGNGDGEALPEEKPSFSREKTAFWAYYGQCQSCIDSSRMDELSRYLEAAKDAWIRTFNSVKAAIDSRYAAGDSTVTFEDYARHYRNAGSVLSQCCRAVVAAENCGTRESMYVMLSNIGRDARGALEEFSRLHDSEVRRINRENRGMPRRPPSAPYRSGNRKMGSITRETSRAIEWRLNRD